MRSYKTLATILVALALAACGGGGGGGDSPAPTPTPVPVPDTTKPMLTLATSSPAATTTTIVFTSNEDLGGNVAVTVKNGKAVVAGSTSLNAGNRGITWTPAAPLSCNTAYAVSAVGTDLAGNTSDPKTGTVTTVACPPLKYSDKVVAFWTDGYPYLVTGPTAGAPVVKLTNGTSYQTGAIPVSSCGATASPMTDGYVLAECTAAADLKRHPVKLNLTTNVVSDFTGTVPAGTAFVLSESNSTQPVAGTTSCHAHGGWFYADPAAAWRLLFQSDAGGAPVVVKAGTFATDGTIGVLRCYRNN